MRAAVLWSRCNEDVEQELTKALVDGTREWSFGLADEDVDIEDWRWTQHASSLQMAELDVLFVAMLLDGKRLAAGFDECHGRVVREAKHAGVSVYGVLLLLSTGKLRTSAVSRLSSCSDPLYQDLLNTGRLIVPLASGYGKVGYYSRSQSRNTRYGSVWRWTSQLMLAIPLILAGMEATSARGVLSLPLAVGGLLGSFSLLLHHGMSKWESIIWVSPALVTVGSAALMFRTPSHLFCVSFVATVYMAWVTRS